jgi:hypothetical protein
MKYAGKNHHLGYFVDEEEAARAYDRAARAHHGEKAQLNVPAEGEDGAKQQQEQEGAIKKTSNYRGVTWDKSKWKAQIHHTSKKHHLGCFDDEEEAARAYDSAARAHRGEKADLNFPAEGVGLGSRRSTEESVVAQDQQ